MDKTKRIPVLIERFEQAAQDHSGQVALELGEDSYTYQQLRGYALQYAKLLKQTDHEPLSGVFAARSMTAYSGILGTLYASKGYVPLNPRFPAERNAGIIRQSGIRTIVAGSEFRGELRSMLDLLAEQLNVIFPAGTSKGEWEDAFPVHSFFVPEEKDTLPDPEITSDSDSTAYLLFTSGSTGRPKGVPVSNDNVCAYMDNLTGNFSFLPSDRFSQTFDLTFDLSVHDLFVCWLSGACLVIPTGDTPFAWSKYIREKEISVWFSVPSAAVMMAKMRLLKENAFSGLKYSFFCGEPLYAATAKAWQKAAPASQLVNLYGPTEATIAFSEFTWPDNEPNAELNGIVSIGKIFPGQDHQISDEGELLLGGSQVVKEYFNDEENTRKSFVEKDGKHWYKTGDLVTEKNNKLYFLGRVDSEVKISGYRVNLHEVEHATGKITSEAECVAVFHKKSETDSGRLVLFINRLPSDDLRETEILEHSRKNLPWYMVPEKIIFVDAFVYNVNGKVDRKKLAEKYL